MQKKIVGGFFSPDERGEITIPPEQSLKFSITNNKDWVSIPVQKTRRKETER